jgi:hypothetical protein
MPAVKEDVSASDRRNVRCRIVGISGSIRPRSYTTMAVALALKDAQELQCEIKLIDLRDYQLPFCDGKEDESKFPRAFSVSGKRSGRRRGSFWARRSIMAATAES